MTDKEYQELMDRIDKKIAEENKRNKGRVNTWKKVAPTSRQTIQQLTHKKTT